MSRADFDAVASRIDTFRDLAIDLETKLTAIPALDPSSGGDGEGKKAALLLDILKDFGIQDISVHHSPDERISDGKRPNIVARIPGKNRQKTVWFMAHMDVVPAGDLNAWESDPWTVRVDGNKIYGRGVEDNQQGLVASLCLAQALQQEGITPECDVGLLYVADEETGNSLGIEYLLDNHDIFGNDDIIVVPDGGEPDGSMIEVAEKGIVWFKFAVKGKSTHGSTPERGVNAHEAAAHLIVNLAELWDIYDHSDPVFDPPVSTFAVTKIEGGVPNVNTVPGDHTFYMDCRVHPKYDQDDVVKSVQAIVAKNDADRGTSTTVEVVQRQDAAPPTPVDAPVVGALKAAVKEVYDVEARPMGIGGGTVAAFIRKKGFGAAVWACMDETMHGPNEYCILDNLLGDAKVFAHLVLAQ